MVFDYSDGLNLARVLVAPAATERNKAVREMGINNASPKMPWKIRLNLGEEPISLAGMPRPPPCSRAGHKWGKGDHSRPVSETLFSRNPMPLIRLLRRHNFAFRRAEPESDREIAQPDYDGFNRLSNSNSFSNGCAKTFLVLLSSDTPTLSAILPITSTPATKQKVGRHTQSSARHPVQIG